MDQKGWTMGDGGGNGKFSPFSASGWVTAEAAELGMLVKHGSFLGGLRKAFMQECIQCVQKHAHMISVQRSFISGKCQRKRPPR